MTKNSFADLPCGAGCGALFCSEDERDHHETSPDCPSYPESSRPLDSCSHDTNEDHMNCAECGVCREDLGLQRKRPNAHDLQAREDVSFACDVMLGTRLDDALRYWDRENPQGDRVRRALFASFWFIENVSEDDMDRTDLFHDLRALVQEVTL